jgi:hypothetical protein
MLAFFLFMSFAVRRYVYRVLELERTRLGLDKEAYRELRAMRASPQIEQPGIKRQEALTLQTITAPIRAEITQFKSSTTKTSGSFWSEIKRLRLFILTIVILILGIAAITWYFVEVFQEERAYHIEVQHDGGKMIIR